MSWGAEDAARIAGANLLDNFREQWAEDRKLLMEASRKLDDFVYGCKTGQIYRMSDVVSVINDILTLTAQDPVANTNLELRVREYIRHTSRRKPRPRLTIKYLTACQQASTTAISRHFQKAQALYTFIMAHVYTNVNLLKDNLIVPKSMRDQIDAHKLLGDDYEEDEYIPQMEDKREKPEEPKSKRKLPFRKKK